MASKPKKKAEDLIDQMNRLLHEEGRDEVALFRLKKDAAGLRSADPYISHILQGMVASLDRDAQTMRRNFTTTLRLNPGDPIGSLQYATSLNNLAFYAEARDLTEKVYRKNEADLYALNCLIERCLKSGRPQDAKKWLRRWGQESPMIGNHSEGPVESVARLFAENGVADDEVENVVAISIAVLHRHETYPEKAAVKVLEDEESEWVSYLIEIKGSIAEVVDLNFEAAEKLAESSISPDISDLFVVTFTSAVS